MGRSVPEFITIGRVIGTWGARGQVKVEMATDFPDRFSPNATVYISHQAMTIEDTAWHKGKAVIKISAIDSPEQAQKLRGQTIEISYDQLRPLPDGQYYHFQLVGLEVWTTGNELLGHITEILTAESNDNYIVSGERGSIFIPAIEDVVKSVDLEAGRMIIEPISGLLTLNQQAT